MHSQSQVLDSASTPKIDSRVNVTGSRSSSSRVAYDGTSDALRDSHTDIDTITAEFRNRTLPWSINRMGKFSLPVKYDVIVK